MIKPVLCNKESCNMYKWESILKQLKEAMNFITFLISWYHLKAKQFFQAIVFFAAIVTMKFKTRYDNAKSGMSMIQIWNKRKR